MYTKAMMILFVSLFFISCGDDEEGIILQGPTDRPLSAVSFSDRNNFYDSAPEFTIDSTQTYTATIHTRKGNIVVELDARNAPLHTNNFVFLSNQGFYDGLTFHRYVSGFVVQGGDPIGAGNGGPGYTIPAEIGLLHDTGVIAAARQSDAVNPQRNSSGSQFYFTLTPQPSLNGAYSVFGKVTQGMNVVSELRQNDVIGWIDIE
jgi:peptidyl-prolyl cis-trans isomerase B (cyclophilin B)